MGAKFLAVAKEVETDVDETLAELGAGEVGGGCAVKDELADVLAEAAADVEELGAGLKTGEEAGVEVARVARVNSRKSNWPMQGQGKVSQAVSR